MAWPDSSEGLSIIIPTYNERENIEQLLAELASVAPRLNGPAEVVLVDDRSPDGTAELAGELGRGKGLNLRGVTRNGPRSLGGGSPHGLGGCLTGLVLGLDPGLS